MGTTWKQEASKQLLSFFTELKRRNVFRVAIAYVITTWLIAQVAVLAAESFGAPAWVMKMIITMLALGAPIALVLAWAYELTPEGLRRDSGSDTGKASSGKLDRTIIVVLLAALAYLAWDKFVLDPQRDQAMLESASQTSTQAAAAQAGNDEQPAPSETPSAPAVQSIAVLSFVNMSDDASNEYFSDGLSEELLNMLVKIPELRVAARTSSFSFKGKDVKVAQIAQELGVTHVLEGSVRKSGNQIRVTAQLIKADDGFHLWSETFDRTLDDIFVVQDEIATAVVDALKVTLMGEMPAQRQTDPEVYALYLQGKYLNNLNGTDNLQKALDLLQQAVAIDPEYAPAWSQMMYSYSLLVGSGGIARDEGIPLAMQSLEKALEIDDQLASAWAGMAYIKRSYFWDLAGAKAAADKALQLEPNNSEAIGSAGSIASTFGEMDKSIELFERNVELDPLKWSSQRALGGRYRAVNRTDEAMATFQKLKDLNPEYRDVQEQIALTFLRMGEPGKSLQALEDLPDSARLRQFQAAAYFDLGDFARAQALADDLVGPPPQRGALALAVMHAWRGENDAAFEWLDLAWEEREPNLAFILWNFGLSKLRDDPRYSVYLEKLGLREAWEAMPPEWGGPEKLE